MKKRSFIRRIIIYFIGTAILTFGITMNVKTDLGVSPTNSIGYTISVVSGAELGNMTFIVFCIFLGMEILLLRKKFKWINLLQVPISLVFSKMISLFNQLISFPEMNLIQKLILMVVAIIATGIGAGTMLAMRLPPNAVDGLVQVVSDVTGKSAGTCKNIIDIISTGVTIMIGLVWGGHLIGIGIGTVCSVIFVGRVIAIYQKLTKAKLQAFAGVDDNSFK